MSKANERERAEMSKDATKEALRLAREALKTCDNKQARALLIRVIDDLTSTAPVNWSSVIVKLGLLPGSTVPGSTTANSRRLCKS